MTETTTLKEIYKSNFKDIIKQVFRNQETKFETKDMCDRLGMLANVKQLISFVTPG